MTSDPHLKLLAGIAPVLLLGGCVKFGAKPPPQLLTLAAPSTSAQAEADPAADTPIIYLASPEAPRKLSTMRVPVQVDDTSLAFVKDAQWVDTPRQLFRTALEQALSAGGKAMVLNDGQYPAGSGSRKLSGELTEFGMDARTRQAIVVYDAMLTTGDARTMRKRFTATAPARKIDAKNVAAPISRAANDVAAQVAAWISAN